MNFKIPSPPNVKHNKFYPNCGCKNEEECEPCPNCGMCASSVDYCACCPTPSGVDKSFHYNPHRDILGG